MNVYLLNIVLIAWNELVDPFVENFTSGIFEGNLPVLGMIVFLFFLMFILALRFSVPLLAVIMIPILFWINSWAGMKNMLVIAGILLGAVIAGSLLKLYNKR